MKRLPREPIRRESIATAMLLLGLSVACAEPPDRAKEMSSAREVFEIPITTSSPEALDAFQRGREAQDLGRNLEANALFRTAVEIDPGFAHAWLDIADSANSATEFKEGLDAATANLEGKSDGERLLVELNRTFLSNDTDARMRIAGELVDTYPTSPRAWIARGYMQGTLKLHEDARRSFGKALELDPDSVAANVALWISYLFNDPVDFERSRAHAERVIELRPEEAKAHEFLGDSLRASQDLEGAAEAYSVATVKDPELSVAQLKKGHVSSFLGRFDEARAAYDAGVEGARQLNRATYANYRAFTYLHADDPQGALDEMSEILQAIDGMDLPDHQARSARIFTLSNRAVVALHHEMLDEAKNDVTALAAAMRESAAAVDDEDFTRQQEAAILIWEGRLAAHEGDFDAARTKAEGNAALLRDDSNPRKLEAHNSLLGLAALLEGDADRAVHLLQKSDLALIYNKFRLAQALEKAGRNDEATELYGEVGRWNFNSVGFALVRREALAKAS